MSGAERGLLPTLPTRLAGVWHVPCPLRAVAFTCMGLCDHRGVLFVGGGVPPNGVFPLPALLLFTPALGKERPSGSLHQALTLAHFRRKVTSGVIDMAPRVPRMAELRVWEDRNQGACGGQGAEERRKTAPSPS